MRRFVPLLTAFFVAALAALPALAQTQNVQPIRRATYSAGFVALTPAASATDFFTLTGSASKTIWVHGAGCSGASTAAALPVVQVVKRSTANSAGTSVNLTEVPHDSLSSAASATALSYTANPTTGTLVGVVRTFRMATDAAASTATPTAPTPVGFRFGEVWTQPIVLRGTAQVLAFNANGASFAAGTTLSCWVEWSE